MEIKEIPIVRTKLIREYNLEISNNKVYGIEEAQEIFQKLIGGSTLERIALICLNTKNEIVNGAIINIGNNKTVEVVPSEVFRIALLSNADTIMICHNHPTGDIRPSTYDFEITKKIGYLGNMMGIRLIDSLILGEEGNCLSIRAELNNLGDNHENR